MDHRVQIVEELKQNYAALTQRIAALDTDISHTLDTEHRLVLDERRAMVATERDAVARQIAVIEKEQLQPTGASAPSKRRTMEYDELTRLIYEVRSDVAVLAQRLNAIEVQIRERCSNETTPLPSQYLILLAIGGVVTLLMLVFLTVRIGFSG